MAKALLVQLLLDKLAEEVVRAVVPAHPVSPPKGQTAQFMVVPMVAEEVVRVVTPVVVQVAAEQSV